MDRAAEIIVIRYNQPRLEKKCVKSVKKKTNLQLHRLTMVDNYCADRSIGSVWNAMIQASKYEYICLLNSDTEVVTDGWLDKLCETANSFDAVGPMTNKCGIHFQVGEASDSPSLKPCTTLSGFCLVFRKSAWLKYGGFREDFSFYGQESNFLDRMEDLVVRRDVFVKHVAGASARQDPERQKEDKALGLEQYQRNRKFDFTKKLAIIGSPPFNPFPLWKGIEQALVEFSREGMEVKYVSVDASPMEMGQLANWAPDCLIMVCSRDTNILRWKEYMDRFRCPRCLWWNDLRPGEGKEHFKGMFDFVFLCYEDGGYYPYSWEGWIDSMSVNVKYMPQGSIINPQLYQGKKQWTSLFIGDVTNKQYHASRSQITEKFNSVVINEKDRPDRVEVENKSRYYYRSAMFCWSMSPYVCGYTSLRTYNILAYGGLALVKNFPNLDRLFKDKKHLLAFSGEDDAKRKMREFYGDSVAAEKIRKMGWRRQQAKHTALYRLQNIMSNALGWDDTFWGYL